MTDECDEKKDEKVFLYIEKNFLPKKNMKKTAMKLLKCYKMVLNERCQDSSRDTVENVRRRLSEGGIDLNC